MRTLCQNFQNLWRTTDHISIVVAASSLLVVVKTSWWNPFPLRLIKSLHLRVATGTHFVVVCTILLLLYTVSSLFFLKDCLVIINLKYRVISTSYSPSVVSSFSNMSCLRSWSFAGSFKQWNSWYSRAVKPASACSSCRRVSSFFSRSHFFVTFKVSSKATFPVHNSLSSSLMVIVLPTVTYGRYPTRRGGMSSPPFLWRAFACLSDLSNLCWSLASCGTNTSGDFLEGKKTDQLDRESEAWKRHLPNLLNNSVGLFERLWWWWWQSEVAGRCLGLLGWLVVELQRLYLLVTGLLAWGAVAPV
jgi:hypothetical protein